MEVYESLHKSKTSCNKIVMGSRTEAMIIIFEALSRLFGTDGTLNITGELFTGTAGLPVSIEWHSSGAHLTTMGEREFEMSLHDYLC